jgi:PleD family two-component response regulator
VDGALARSRILAVDDNGLSRKKMRMAVQGLRYDAEMAENGTQALERLRADRFDSVLLDILMPEMDGFGVLGELKGDEAFRDIPVIVISALDDETDSVVRAIKLGAEDFMPK